MIDSSGLPDLEAGTLRQLLDATSAVVAVKEPQGRYLYVNAAFVLLMGGRGSDYVGRYDVDIFPPELAARLRGNDLKVLGERRELVFEEILDIRGQRHVFSTRKYPLLDARGEPWAVCLTAEDVTEARRTDQALRDSEASYRAIFEASEDCIFLHDIDTGTIVDVNPRACQVYGYDHDTLVGMQPGDLGSGDAPFSQADAARQLQRACAGEVMRFEWRRRNANASEAWDEVCLKRVRLAGVDRILAMTRDVTERKEREAALARSEDRLRATIEASLDCIITMDSGGRVTDFNPAAETCFGYRREQAVGRQLAGLIVPERFRQAHQRGMERYLQEGRRRMLGRRVELVAMRSDGSEFPVELAITQAQGAHGLVFIGYLRDITGQREAQHARVQLEAQLRQAQKMEAIGHLAGGVAHDFNNILTGIMGYLGLAEERLAQSPDRRLRTYLRHARHSGRRAGELIKQMLTFSRNQRGHPRVLSPARHLADALRLVRASLPASVELVADLDTATPPVNVDPVQLEQVLMNLCINSRDAMQGSGLMQVRLAAIDASGLRCTSCQQAIRGEHVALVVADEGPGIPEPLMQRMFEPFFSTKPAGVGSGMGLATVHGIVHEHGGHIVVENREAGGASFRVLLPALSGEACIGEDLTADDVIPPAQRILSGRILLVDDDPAARGFMRDLLGEWGLEVTAFDDPTQAATAGQAQHFDAAILDHTMPHMTGPQLARRLREIDEGLPILLYSGYARDLADDDLAASGIIARLAKPVDTVDLFRRLESILGPQPTAPPSGPS